jgi:hypothetical protein
MMHDNVHASLDRIAATLPPPVMCRCCGKPILGLDRLLDRHPIHTRCIPKHWGRHSRGVNATRCKEFDNLIRGG